MQATQERDRHFVKHDQGKNAKSQSLEGISEWRDGIAYPVVVEEEADEPEEEVDVDEEEGVGEEERVRGAPRGHRVGAVVVVVLGADEGEVEEDGRERDEEGDDHVLQVAAATVAAGAHGIRLGVSRWRAPPAECSTVCLRCVWLP